MHVDGKTRHEHVFMNNVLDVKGYRFFQASYDPDEQGTVLSVNRDVAGPNITYTGYLLLVIGLILSLVGKNSRFMALSRRLKEFRSVAQSATMVIALLALSVSVNAKEETSSMLDAVQKYAVSPEHAAKFGALPIQSHSGRMMPINTFSSKSCVSCISRTRSESELRPVPAEPAFHAGYVDARSFYRFIQ